MKKIALLMTFFVVALFANATVYLDETFSATTAGSTIEGSAGWSTSGTNTGNKFTALGSSLTYSNGGGTAILSGVGQTINSTYTTGGVNYMVYKPFNGSSIGTGNTVYASFLYSTNSTAQSQTQSPVISLGSGSATGVQLWVGKGTLSTSNFRFGTTRGSTSGSDIKWASAEYTADATVFFIVLKYDLTTQTSYLYVNPIVASGSEPSADATDATSTTKASSIQYIQFKVNGSNRALYSTSGVRVASTWAEAVAKYIAPGVSLSAPTVGTASDETLTSFTANWSAVANASSYSVKTYLGANLISTTPVASGTSVAISGLMSGTDYTYTVKAIGDGGSYSDSPESSSSATVTTAGRLATINTDFSDGTWGTVAEVAYTTGAFPTSSINGYDLVAAGFYFGSTKGAKGESHTNRIAVDKASAGGKVTLPTVSSLEQLEIHATFGSGDKDFLLKEFNPTTNTWTQIGDYTYNLASKTTALDSIYIIPISRAIPTKFRIENNTSSGLYIAQIITRTTNPALLDRPVAAAASAITESGFTANWTAIANASSYVVKVYAAGTLVGTYPVSGGSTESYVISDLSAVTEYTYKVQAIGDGDVTFSDSFLSIASAPVTTDMATNLNELKNKVVMVVSGNMITADQQGDIKIYDVQGAQVFEANGVTKVNTHLSNGMYIVRLTNVNGIQSVKKVSIR
ncbi:MAG: T9SS type A sorting domain-containing protein [Bacteroidales bacterium]|nr:T9SS type A sorting domain-containing protein [Bacteroidales bacterium]